ncbi:MAG TPA: hypothetical protein VEB86_07945 [Chryseosolibacter sp.]|nr:hypothetical protein [Chryseosolibacter sp.]
MSPDELQTPSCQTLQKLTHPAFLFSLVVLLANDWILKTCFHNALTGKLSDFAGLFALPFFLSCLAARWKMQIHIAVGIAFVFWKSEFSQPGIDLINSVGIPVARTVDPTDNLALVSIVASGFVWEKNPSWKSRPAFILPVILISAFAFMATSVPRSPAGTFKPANKEYHFDLSINELVSRFNAIQLKEIAIASKMSGGMVDFDSARNIFHYHNSDDTLALILDHRKLSAGEPILYRTSYVEILMTGDDDSSILSLVSMRIPSVFSPYSPEKAVRKFEKHVIKKIRKMPKAQREHQY